eukprot:4520145-Prymnesium_polylepis.1
MDTTDVRKSKLPQRSETERNALLPASAPAPRRRSAWSNQLGVGRWRPRALCLGGWRPRALC